jgi:hypothetical protein
MPEPGWYNHPTDQQLIAEWNGEKWTGRTMLKHSPPLDQSFNGNASDWEIIKIIKTGLENHKIIAIWGVAAFVVLSIWIFVGLGESEEEQERRCRESIQAAAEVYRDYYVGEVRDAAVKRMGEDCRGVLSGEEFVEELHDLFEQ